ncbi:MAG: hypothetical protein JWR61_490 [Ferruginibacter sp.]|uniref:hypothetical protein n=1 Tax=Ferruginibacter sp. TaxID=1940288 RepID=UPI0026580CFA|nr:hypothetical protein [Ferruginibacter sp.]MDB5275535.1 hypothetical protein [Ferruginibacter sp.]
MNILSKVKRNYINARGWCTPRKIVVIESDDWGSIRMPSKEIYSKLSAENLNVERDPYLKYDCLENSSDLTALFEILCSVKDSNGHFAVITANTVVANPDFDKIRLSAFSKYYFEPFTETLKKYDKNSSTFLMIKQGIENKIYHPQFHGREHLNVDRWMLGIGQHKDLLRKAFDLKMISISSVPCELKYCYMEGLDYFNETELDNKVAILNEGMDLFKEIFGFTSESFIANCYIWSKRSETVLAGMGVKYLQGIYNQFQPVLFNHNRHDLRVVSHYMGERNQFGQRYLLRNAFFEPSLKSNADVADECLKRIEIAFRWNKPAIICSHRLNFIGSIDINNRDKNLKMFSTLLRSIMKKWPAVEFMTSDQLGNLIEHSN